MHLYQLEDLIRSNMVIVFNHVRRKANKVVDWMENHEILDKNEGQSFHWDEMKDMEITRRATEITSTYLKYQDAGDMARHE